MASGLERLGKELDALALAPDELNRQPRATPAPSRTEEKPAH